ncbi:MAG TPA: hypothetical protein VK249_11110 [Anaerolineales bacterium]|nr:hypothetical protein [Anaerolineales bacterium]
MGRKGVSKRKPKKTFSNDNINHGSSNARPGQSSSPVQALVNARDAPLINRAGANPSNGSNKKNRKGR